MSHHSNQPPPPEFLRALQHKMQGEFPEGRLNSTDQGAVTVMIGHEHGKVVMQFPHPTVWIGFTSQQAIDIAKSLIDHARQCGGIVELKI